MQFISHLLGREIQELTEAASETALRKPSFTLEFNKLTRSLFLLTPCCFITDKYFILLVAIQGKKH